MRIKKIISAVLAVSCLTISSIAFADGLTIKLVNENGNGNANKQVDVYPLMTLGDDFNIGGLVTKYNAIAQPNDVSEDTAFKTAALTMASYVVRDKVKATASQLTDENGIAKFDDLPEGMYLVIDPEYYTNRYRYAAAPYIMEATEDNSSFVTLDPVVKKMTNSVSSVRYVTVAWDMSTGSPATIPESVTLQVLKDGKPYGEEVTITAADGWSYMFEDMSLANSWNIMEKNIPDGFAVNVSDDGRDVKITNVASPSMAEISSLGQALAKDFMEGLDSEYIQGQGEITKGSNDTSDNASISPTKAQATSGKSEAKATDKPKASESPKALPSASPSASPNASPSASPAAKDANSPKTGDTSNAPLLITLAVLLFAAAGVGVYFVFIKKPNGEQ